MKKTFKKILAVMLAVVLLFGAAPLCKTDGILTTKASALETVEGSYDYLVKYIKQNGYRGSTGDLCISKEYNGKDAIISVHAFCDENNYLYFNYRLLAESGMSNLQFTVQKDKPTSLMVVSYNLNGFEDIAQVTIEPQKYTPGMALNYKIEAVRTNDSSYIKSLNTLFNSTVKSGLKGVSDYLTATVGFGLGNFGFTNISDPAPVPSEAGSWFFTILAAILVVIEYIRIWFFAIF